MEKRKIIAAGGLVLNEDGQLLMIYRRGKWDIPKGKLDDGETIAECAVREVKEETGLTDVLLGDFLAISYHEYFDPYLKEDVVKESHWYMMKAPGVQALIPQTVEHITEIRWVSGEELERCLGDSFENVVEVVRKAGF